MMATAKREKVLSFVVPVVAALVALVLAESAAQLFSSTESETPEHQFWKYDPEIGWSHRSNEQGTFQSKLNGFHSTVKLGGFGTRENDNDIQGPFEHTILVVGDSVTAGFEVENNQTFSAVLEKRLFSDGRKIRVVNSGVRGYGTDQAYLTMKRLIPVFKPDVVLYVYCWNDLTDNLAIKNRFRLFSKPAFVLTESGKLQLENSPAVPMPIGHYDFVYFDREIKHIAGDVATTGPLNWLRTHTLFYPRLEDLYYTYVVKPPVRPENERIGKKYTTDLLAGILSQMKADAPRLVVTSLISNHRALRDKVDIIENASRELGLEFIDLRPFFVPESEEFIFPNDGHWNVKGHAAAANGLHEYFRSSLPRANPVAMRPHK